MFYLVWSGKIGKQTLRFRTRKTFFFVIKLFLYQNGNPVDHIICWKQFYVSLNNNNPPNSISFMPDIVSTSGRIHSETSILTSSSKNWPPKKTTVSKNGVVTRVTVPFFETSGVQFHKPTSGQFHFHLVVFETLRSLFLPKSSK